MIIVGIIILAIILGIAASIGRATEKGVNRFLGDDDE